MHTYRSCRGGSFCPRHLTELLLARAARSGAAISKKQSCGHNGAVLSNRYQATIWRLPPFYLGVDVHDILLRVRPDKIQLRVPPTTANRVRGYVRFRDAQVLDGFSFDSGPAV